MELWHPIVAIKVMDKLLSNGFVLDVMDQLTKAIVGQQEEKDCIFSCSFFSLCMGGF